jgi:hypothetical protein
MSFSKHAEEELLQAVRKVAAYAEGDGLTPTDAVVKAAAELRVPSEYVPLMVQAYNQGRATMQRTSCGDDMLCKIANFPLADAQEAMQKLYPSVLGTPEHEKDAVSPEYSAPPRRKSRSQNFAVTMKAAASTVRDEKSQLAKVFGQQQAEKRAFEELRRQAGEASHCFAVKLAETVEYFKQPASLRLSFAEVEGHAVQMFGSLAANVLDYAYKMAGLREERADAKKPPKTRAVRTEAPYRQVTTALDAAQAAVGYEKRLAKAKQASVFQYAFGSGMGRGLEDALSRNLAPKQPDVLLQKALLQLEDPAHLNELRQIEAKGMLSDLLRNDDVIRGYQPDETLDAYNEIAALSPRAATHAAVMRPLLRKRLAAGAVEPFEGQQLLDIEQGIRESTSSPGSFALGNFGNDKKHPVLGS